MADMRDSVKVLVPASTYNPAVAEDLMVRAAADLSAQIINRDDLARWGGDRDFVVMLSIHPHMEDDEVKNTLEALVPDLSWSRHRAAV